MNDFYRLFLIPEMELVQTFKQFKQFTKINKVKLTTLTSTALSFHPDNMTPPRYIAGPDQLQLSILVPTALLDTETRATILL
jgi:hypothetical protein